MLLPASATASTTTWYFKTVTFKNVGDATDEQYYDVLDILPKKGDGSDWSSTVTAQALGNGALILQRISTDGVYSDRIQYCSRGTITGWQTMPKSAKDGTAHALDREEFMIKKGEGLIVQYKKTADCLLQFSGEVELNDLSYVIPASATASTTYWKFSGNFSPVTIDILKVKPTKEDGSEWSSTVTAQALGNGALVLQKISTDGVYSDRIQYCSRGTITGWQTMPKSASEPAAHALTENEWTLAPGEGFLIQYKKTAACKLTFPKPIQEKTVE